MINQIRIEINIKLILRGYCQIAHKRIQNNFIYLKIKQIFQF